jgi:hypothetical protein
MRRHLSRRTVLKAAATAPAAGVAPTVLGTPAPAGAATPATLTVSPRPWGVSTRYIGADRGITGFDIADLRDLGINTYRFYEGHTYAWHWEDSDGEFGRPSIEQIQADPDVIDWAWWDEAMANPPEGSPFWYATEPGVGWQGNWHTIFASLKEAGIKPVVSFRVQNSALKPDWAAPLNPPRTPQARNEWWAHVYACVYWLNVRNDYRVDDWELGNEPNHDGQGWLGTEADHWDFVRLTKDAIDDVYRRYLPGRPYRAYAPVSAGTSVNDEGVRFGWIKDALEKVPECFDSVDYHDFTDDPTGNIREVHQIMTATGHGDRPLWVTEWGPVFGHGPDSYLKVSSGLLILQNLIRMSRPDSYVYGNHIVNLYDAPNRAYLVAKDGTRRVTYYAFRMGIRALQGGRTTFESVASTPDLTALTTRDDDGAVWVLAVNTSQTESYDVRADLSGLVGTGPATVWEFSERRHDEEVGRRHAVHGRVRFGVPAQAGVLLRFGRRRH